MVLMKLYKHFLVYYSSAHAHWIQSCLRATEVVVEVSEPTK